MGKNIEELNTNIKEAIVAYSKSLLIDAENHNFHFSKKDLSLTPK
jgi:predicted RNase H-like HicB family nuclease